MLHQTVAKASPSNKLWTRCRPSRKKWLRQERIKNVSRLIWLRQKRIKNASIPSLYYSQFNLKVSFDTLETETSISSVCKTLFSKHSQNLTSLPSLSFEITLPETYLHSHFALFAKPMLVLHSRLYASSLSPSLSLRNLS